jgi:hypothetical protein
VQLAKHRHRGEGASGGLVRGRQVVQMEQVGPASARAPEQLDPGSDQPFVGGIVDCGKDSVGRIRAILEGGRERNAGSQRLRTLERGGVVERVDVDPGEEARRVGLLTRPPERPRGQRQLPPRSLQGASERARDLRRAAAGKEKERRHDQSACLHAAAALRLLPPPRIACYLHGSILASRYAVECQTLVWLQIRLIQQV